MATQFTLRTDIDLSLLDILIFVKIIKEKILCVALWNVSAKGTCVQVKTDNGDIKFKTVRSI